MATEPRLFREQALICQQTDSTGSIVFYQPLTLKVLLLLVVVAFGTFLTYAALADINQTVLVRGFVSSTEGEIKIYATRAGQLDTLPVKNGDVVSTAQVLATVVDQGVDQLGDDMRRQSMLHLERQIEHIRQRLALSQQRLILQDALSESKRQSLGSELALRQHEHELAGWQLENASNEFRRLELLNLNLAVSDSELASSETSLLAMQKSQQVSILSVNVVASQLEDLATQQQLDTLRLHDESLALAFSLSQLQQRRDEMRLEHGYALTAPSPGRVENLLNRTGDQLNARQPLLSIVPLQPVYKAQLFLPSRALGNVAVGQRIILVYDAYPRYEHGSFMARVSSLSAVPIDPREYLIPLDINEPVYLLEAELLPDHRQLVLRPGLQFSAELVVGSQSILNRIVEPLRSLEHRLR